MCDLTKEFKLCSCDGDKLAANEIGWILYRRNVDKTVDIIRGKPFIYQLSSKEENIKTLVGQQLNSKNCFDFEYKPKEDDFLKIRIKKGKTQWYAFRFLGATWHEDKSISFDSWRQQLEKLKEGYCSNSTTKK